MTRTEAVTLLNDLRERVTTLAPEEIEREVRTFARMTAVDLYSFTIDELGAATNRGKTALCVQIYRSLMTARRDRMRVDSILNS